VSGRGDDERWIDGWRTLTDDGSGRGGEE